MVRYPAAAVTLALTILVMAGPAPVQTQSEAASIPDTVEHFKYGSIGTEFVVPRTRKGILERARENAWLDAASKVALLEYLKTR